MNPAIKRKVRNGKHQKLIVEKSHLLFEKYSIDVLDPNTAKDILEEEEDAEFLIHFLRTTEPVRKMYSNYQYRVALEQIEIIATTLTNYLKTIRANKTRKRNKINEEDKIKAIKKLKSFSNSFLAQVIVKKLSKDEINKVIELGQKRQAKKQAMTKRALPTLVEESKNQEKTSYDMDSLPKNEER